MVTVAVTYPLEKSGHRKAMLLLLGKTPLWACLPLSDYSTLFL